MVSNTQPTLATATRYDFMRAALNFGRAAVHFEDAEPAHEGQRVANQTAADRGNDQADCHGRMALA